MTNLSHNASFHSNERIAPSNRGIKHLDRCRPDYALEILEVIKHFFSVPHLHFVLGTNLVALENSIHARYGERVDASAYLKKFIQLTLELPNSFGPVHQRQYAPVTYLKHLIQEMAVPNHIAEELLDHVELIYQHNDISMRDIEKITSLANLSSSTILKNESILSGWIEILVDLIVIKIVRPDLYPKFLNADVDIDDFCSYIGATKNMLEREIDGERNKNFDRLFAIKCDTWLFLSQNGLLTNGKVATADMIAKRFERFGDLDDPKSVPMEVSRRWLDQFEFYRQEKNAGA